LSISAVAEKTSPHLLQLDLFESHLPAKPYCSDSLPAGLVIRSKQEAMRKRFIQPNGPTHLYWLVYDVDRSTASYDWDDLRAPPPNICAMNPDNGHAHLFYGLEVPVRKAPDAQLKPLRYAAAVEWALCQKLDADYGYAGLIAKNPLHDHWTVTTYEQNAYSLGWLAEYIDLERVDYRTRPTAYGLGRNCTLFNQLRHWAYRAKSAQNWDLTSWKIAVLERAAGLNTFPAPLPLSEIRSTAKSVARWVWANYDGQFTDEQFRRRQAARGRLSGVSRRRESDRKGQLVFTFEGLPAAVVASMTGLPLKTVYRLRSRQKKPKQ